MVADDALPVWTIKPNWAEGIIERLSWLTDVLASTFGTEQRRALRLSPRREFEMKFNPVDQARSYFDLWLHRLGSQEFMSPLFHDSGKLTAGIAAAAVTIPFDTTYREFVAGGLAVIIGDDPFTFDKVTVTAIAADHITVAAGGITRAWSKGSHIHPLRRSRLSDESQAAALTNRVGEGTLQFQLNQANDIPDEGAWAATYGTHPIILEAPNRRDNLDLTFNRNTLLLDNDQGLRTLNDDAGRAFTIQADSRMMVGRAEHWAFRQMLYRLRGKQGTVWLPSFNRDVELSRAAIAADSALKIKKIGYGYTGPTVDGRTNLLLPGNHGASIIGVGADPSASEEQLTLSAPLGFGLPAGSFGSFMDTCRLASDDVEIKHETDTDGAAECKLTFRSFRDQRVAPNPNDYAIPAAVTSAAMCDGSVPETGYWGRLIVDTTRGVNQPVMGPWSWSMSLYRAGVFLATIYGSDNYTDFSGGGGFISGAWDYLTGWTSTFFQPDLAIPRGESGWAVDPFGGLLPDEIKVDIQWPYNNYIFPGGSTFGSGVGAMDIKFQLINGPTIDFGNIPIFGLWPAHYDVHA